MMENISAYVFDFFSLVDVIDQNDTHICSSWTNTFHTQTHTYIHIYTNIYTYLLIYLYINIYIHNIYPCRYCKNVCRLLTHICFTNTLNFSFRRPLPIEIRQIINFWPITSESNVRYIIFLSLKWHVLSWCTPHSWAVCNTHPYNKAIISCVFVHDFSWPSFQSLTSEFCEFPPIAAVFYRIFVRQNYQNLLTISPRNSRYWMWRREKFAIFDTHTYMSTCSIVSLTHYLCILHTSYAHKWLAKWLLTCRCVLAVKIW